MKPRFVLLTLALVLLASTLFALQTPGAQPTSANDVFQDDVLVTTSQGASLRVVVMRKLGQRAAVPAVLFYTTYDQPFAINAGKKAVENGFVGVVVYARGIRGDIREYMPYEHDGADLYDVIDWISKQPWCNGKVGMYGGSYTGFAQWATAKRIHPALKTIVPQVAVMPGYDTPMENNVCASFLCLNWPNDTLQNPRLPQDLYTTWYQKGASYRSLDSLAGQPNRIFQTWLQHPAYDDYWQSLIPTPDEFARIRIPVLTTTGYYDGAQIGALRYLKLHYRYNKNAEHYLVIGPYDHRGAQSAPSASLMGYSIDPAANINLEDLAFQWLDYVLTDGKKPAILKDKINYEVMGGNEWRHASSLEHMATDTITFYLTDTPVGGRHLLSPQKPAKAGFLRQTVDLKDRQTQNNLFTQTILTGSLAGANALVFVSEPFTETVTISGTFSGRLTTVTNKKDLDISLGFYELMPDGKYFFLTRYLGRASLARNKSRRQLLRPGVRETVELRDIRMVIKQIGKGSRLAVALHVNKNPFEVINYGSGKNVYDETLNDAGEPLQIKWYNDSYISVPVSK
jgi:putative CocE/NonD family hydrolase